LFGAFGAATSGSLCGLGQSSRITTCTTLSCRGCGSQLLNESLQNLLELLQLLLLDLELFVLLHHTSRTLVNLVDALYGSRQCALIIRVGNGSLDEGTSLSF
jgi:hypothetical protein